MPAGRPRTVSLPPDEMIKLGEEMIQWIKENDPVHLCEFYCIEKGYTDDEWDTMHVCPEFFPYYVKALKIIGMKYLREDTGIEPRIKDRWLRHYFRDLRKQEDKDKDDDTVRKTKVSQADSEAEVKKFREFLNETRGHCEGVSGACRPEVEAQQPLLDQGQPGQEG